MRPVLPTLLLVPLVALAADPEPSPDFWPRPDPDGDDIRFGFGESDEGRRFSSETKAADGKLIPHGVQFSTDAQNRLIAYEVYNRGVFERRRQFYATGETFRAQYRNSDGDGFDTVYAKNPDVVRDVVPVIRGVVKNDTMYDGSFLVQELIPDGFGMRMRVHIYRKGRLVQNDAFPAKRLGLPTSPDKNGLHAWRFPIPEWPRVP